jgi:glycine oxidase
MTTCDAAIVGGGVIGMSLARELSSRGMDVVLIERGRTGEEASSAAAGLLSAQSDADTDSAFFRVTKTSRDLYPAWADALRQETGIDVGWRRTGVLRCGDEKSLAAFLWQREAGFPIERLDSKEIARRSSSRAAPEITHGLFFADDAIVDPRLLVRALRRSLEQRGVRVLEGVEVTGFRVEGGPCRGVESSSGPIRALRVVDAAGAWADLDPSLPFSVPVEPVRGQIVELADDASFPTVLESEDVYLVPRADGRLLVGATVERAGYRKEVTAQAVRGLLDAAFALAPSLASARLTGAWAGLRPGTPDGRPLLGETSIAGLFLAAGHFRHGILLAPWTALAVSDLVAGAGGSELAPFSPERFGPRTVHEQAARAR